MSNLISWGIYPILIFVPNFILSCVLLISYAYYKIKLEGQKEHFISTDTISFSYIENEDKISITSVNPLSDTDGKAQNNYFDF